MTRAPVDKARACIAKPATSLRTPSTHNGRVARRLRSPNPSPVDGAVVEATWCWLTLEKAKKSAANKAAAADSTSAAHLFGPIAAPLCKTSNDAMPDRRRASPTGVRVLPTIDVCLQGVAVTSNARLGTSHRIRSVDESTVKLYTYTV